MKTQRYSVNQQFVETILSWVKSKEIAIPEIQRPFVWDSAKVRNLLDSLYHGYPIGYIIAWQNPSTKLKDGTSAKGKKILIDGQQRITALRASLLGEEIIDREYRRTKIEIAFHPLEHRFEVLNPAIQKDLAWVKDIAGIMRGDTRASHVVRQYCKDNPKVDPAQIEDALENLRDITKRQVGYVELDADLDIELVTDIFIRINSAGVALSQADFAMSKIAANDTYNGSIIRKCIDYFCHLTVAPEFYPVIADLDKEFAATDYFKKMKWLKDEMDDLYEPSYTDLLRVAFTSEFGRGKLSDLVSLLSGRNFETRQYEEEIAKTSFQRLETGILNFLSETHFKRFLMIIRSAGFISSDLVRSQNALNFAYILYLKLRAQEVRPEAIETYVRRWYVFSVLTERYSSSPESTFDYDIRNINERSFEEYLKGVETGELSDAFWDVTLVQRLESPVASSPYFKVYLASQIKANDKGFLSRDISVADLITHKGDIHHVFPKDYLKQHGSKPKDYNQIANYVPMQTEINISVGNKAPHVYFNELQEQCNNGKRKYGNIDSLDELKANLEAHCIPQSVMEMDSSNFVEFLLARRKLMAQKLKRFYFSL